MEKKKEQAKVLSQEMLADGIYSLWIETEAARTARPGQSGLRQKQHGLPDRDSLYLYTRQMQANYFRVRSVSVK